MIKQGHKLSSDEVKAELLNILISFDEFARKEGIQYSLAYGTLLGAVRHGGFIPWDDDIDVVVPRPQYEKIVEFAKRAGTIGEYRFTGYEVDGFPMPFLKLVNPRISVTDIATKSKIKLELWVDIFPLDGCAQDVARYMRDDKKSHYCKALIKTGNYRFWGAGKGRLNRIKKMFAMPFVEAFRLNDKAERYVINLAKSGLSYEDADFVSNLVWGPYGMRERFEKRCVSSTVEMTFEEHSFQAMVGWDEYLSTVYGDYMRLPPENERVAHGIQAWWV